jgi:hypothetical protein
MFKGLGQIGDMARMMKQAQAMQARMGELQEILGRITLWGEAAGGKVTIEANGRGEPRSVRIDPALMADREALQALFLEAIRDMQARAARAAQEEMARIAQDLGLPPGALPG